jgi:hypothetical protein
MFPFSFLVAPLSIFLSLCTASGVFIHDMRIDQVAVAVTAAPVVAAGSMQLVNFANDLHTHAERGSLQQVGESSHSPLIKPRTNNRKYVSQKNMGLGHEPFDSYRMPLAC